MKATETPSQAEIGRALGVVRSRVTALKKQGMPVDSIENALRWHRHYVMAKVPAIGRDIEAAGLRAVEKVEALGRILPAAVDRGDRGMVKEMRAALRAVPRGFRRLIDLPRPVWMLLIDHVYGRIPKADIGATPLSDEDSEFMECFWYSVAAGERTP